MAGHVENAWHRLFPAQSRHQAPQGAQSIGHGSSSEASVQALQA